MWAHGAMGPIVIAAIFWPRMTYGGALWIVTFPAMALALAGVFRRSEAVGSGDGRLRTEPQQPTPQRQPVKSVLAPAE